ncbi:MAG: hypothetical protein ACLR94_17195 [Acutalibacteraceae bacterium]
MGKDITDEQAQVFLDKNANEELLEENLEAAAGGAGLFISGLYCQKSRLYALPVGMS